MMPVSLEAMSFLEPPPTVPEILRNEFAQLQLEIARRADQLARWVISDPATDLDVWSQAEQEVFARYRRPGANVTDL